MKIGIMGGTFDPVHNGHIFTANEVMDKICLDKVMFIPAGNPAHKRNKKITGADLRLKMIEAAAEGYKNFLVSDIEIKREGYTYTVDTLKELHNILPPDTEIIYIIGADVVAELNTWKDYEQDFKLCSFAAVLRPGFSQEDFDCSVKKMQKLGARIIPVNIQQRNISSSEIRERFKAGHPVDGLLPDKVLEIIKRERIYEEGAG